MLKKVTAIVLILLLSSGCAPIAVNTAPKQYNATFLDVFDTVTTVTGLAESEDAFTAKAQTVHDLLKHYHQLFDIYNSYNGLNNLNTVNAQAGIAPVTVDSEIIALLQDCQNYYALTDGKVNVAMGSVLYLWHEAREYGIDHPDSAVLPSIDSLQSASQHADLSQVVIDPQASTVYLPDPQMRLDVGSVAKGWAAQKAANAAPEGLLISVGGNVCASGTKDAAGTPWTVGIQSPDGNGYVHMLRILTGSVVTSGDYQRYYTVDGRRYHHLIDPETLMPAQYWRSVTIVCQDSGLADVLSTALFLMPLEQGHKLLDACSAEAMWIDHNGNFFYSINFQEYIKPSEVKE